MKNWILEKVLAQSSYQVERMMKIIPPGANAWVNTPMRIMEWQQSIKQQVKKYIEGPVSIAVNGSDWGMACNSIHYIDLISWLIESDIDKVSCTELCSWHQSKRPGFYDVYGSIAVRYQNSSTLILNSKDEKDSKYVKIKVETSSGNWTIHETEGKAVGPSGEIINGRLEFQSEMTPTLVKEILTEGTCMLPSLKESALQHKLLLDGLLDSWNKFNCSVDSLVPIT